ncbi:MAG: carbon starvation protein A [Terriglobia bacterium]
MNALPLLLGALAVIAIGYRYYSLFLVTKVAVLDDLRQTPAYRLYDGNNYFPTPKWVLFGHHFAAIAGPGPLIGPVLAAQFGYLPGLLWLVFGVVLGGSVHDIIILYASVRRDGKSLAEIARGEISSLSGYTAAIAILMIVVIAMAGVGLAVVNALRGSAWGTFTIAMTIPIALVMGLWMFRGEKQRVVPATIFGVTLTLAALIVGRWIPGSPLAHYLSFDQTQITLLLAAYGFIASVLPVWLLLSPRDYLSSYMKIGVVVALILGVMIAHPDLKMAALTKFVHGGGPIIPGKVYPFVFITIACGAISGFHALIGSGTTPKMISKESHIRPIGYGAMLVEGIVGIVCLVAATSMYPGDYYTINIPVQKMAAVQAANPDIADQLVPKNLPMLEAEVGEKVAGRTGGAVSLAVGMAQIFTSIPGLRHLMSYWYHFAIVFEALFILTTIDAGTRVARFILQELMGKAWKPMAKTDWLPGSILATGMIVFAWAYFIMTGSISTIWPMFGIANQLLASIALCVGTTVIINSGRARYAWVTLLPLSFVATTTLTAGWLSITGNFIPLTQNPATAFQGWLDAILTIIMMTALVIVLVDSLRKWKTVLFPRPPVIPVVDRALAAE